MARETKDSLRAEVQRLKAEEKRRAEAAGARTLREAEKTKWMQELEEKVSSLQKDLIDTSVRVGDLEVANEILKEERDVLVNREASHLEEIETATNMLAYQYSIFRAITLYGGSDLNVPRHLANVVISEDGNDDLPPADPEINQIIKFLEGTDVSG